MHGESEILSTERVEQLLQLAKDGSFDKLHHNLLELQGAFILDKNAIRLQKQYREEAEAELAAQKELHATTAAQLAESQEKLEVLQRFDEELQVLGAPLVSQSEAEKR